jgi:subtilase family serine protease
VFGYSQTVTALEAGGGYRAKIDYRWLDAAGNLQRKATRETPVCMQTGDLPNLEALAVTMLSGPATNTAVYQLTVRNVGLAPATDVAVELYVDGAATDVGHIAALAAGEERKVRITGPVCKRVLRAVVDPSDTIHEMSEGDNTSKFPCP